MAIYNTSDDIKYVGWVLTQLLTEKTKNKIKKIAKD